MQHQSGNLFISIYPFTNDRKTQWRAIHCDSTYQYNPLLPHSSEYKHIDRTHFTHFMHIHLLNRFLSEGIYEAAAQYLQTTVGAKQLFPWCTVTETPWHKQLSVEQNAAIPVVMPSASSEVKRRDQSRGPSCTSQRQTKLKTPPVKKSCPRDSSDTDIYETINLVKTVKIDGGT